MAEKRTTTRASSSKVPEVGGEVLVHYLESPNAIRTLAHAKVLAVDEDGALLTVKLTRPGARGELQLSRVPATQGASPTMGLPCWEPIAPPS